MAQCVQLYTHLFNFSLMQLSYQPITWQKGDLSNFEREIFKQFWDATLFYDKSGMAHFFGVHDLKMVIGVYLPNNTLCELILNHSCTYICEFLLSVENGKTFYLKLIFCTVP